MLLEIHPALLALLVVAALGLLLWWRPGGGSRPGKARRAVGPPTPEEFLRWMAEEAERSANTACNNPRARISNAVQTVVFAARYHRDRERFFACVRDQAEHCRFPREFGPEDRLLLTQLVAELLSGGSPPDWWDALLETRSASDLPSLVDPDDLGPVVLSLGAVATSDPELADRVLSALDPRVEGSRGLEIEEYHYRVCRKCAVAATGEKDAFQDALRRQLSAHEAMGGFYHCTGELVAWDGPHHWRELSTDFCALTVARARPALLEGWEDESPSLPLYLLRWVVEEEVRQ